MESSATGDRIPVPQMEEEFGADGNRDKRRWKKGFAQLEKEFSVVGDRV